MKNRMQFMLIMISSALLLCGCGRRTVVLESRVQEEKAAGRASGQTGTQADSPSSEAQTQTESSSALTEAETGSGFSAAQADDPGLSHQGQTEAETEQALILVHVTGQVHRPGVYSLRKGARIYEAVEKAGGFTAQADQSWCNQAQMLSDGDLLRIYSTDETASMTERGMSAREDQFGITHANAQFDVYGDDGAVSASDGSGVSSGPDLSSDGSSQETPVNLNTASREELMTLSGIGQSRADDIIAYREQHGGFSSIEEIKQISGIKDAVFGKIKDHITV